MSSVTGAQGGSHLTKSVSNLVLVGGVDETLELIFFLARVGLSPETAVLVVVLWRVEIGIQAKGLSRKMTSWFKLRQFRFMLPCVILA